MISTNNAKTYCCEDVSNIERYDEAIADTEQTWICHHKLGETGISKEELIARGLYYKRPAYELIFVTKAEHDELHPDNNFKNNELQKELCHRRFINGKLPDKIKQNMRHKHNMTETGRLALSTYRSEQNKRRRWWNNGVINKYCEICPENFKAGRI